MLTPPRAAVALLAVCARAWAADVPAVPEPPAVPSVLRMSDAVRLLRERGLDLLVAEAAVASAEGDVTAAGAIANPALSLSYGRSFTYGSCTDTNGQAASCGLLPQPQYGVGLSDQAALSDALFGKRGLRLRVARAALAGARASRDDALRTLTAQAKTAFVQALTAQETLRFARDVAAASARTAEITRARWEAGAISEADVARVDVARLEADAAVDGALQTLRDAKLALAFLLGARGPVPEFDLEGPDLLRAAPPPALRQGATVPALLDRARAHRPDLVAAVRQRERAEAAVALARRSRWPDVALSVSYAQQGTTSSAITPPTATVGLSLPLPVFYRQQGEIQKAEADLATQRLLAAKAEAQVTSDVESAWADWQTAARLTARMQDALLARARRARDLVEVQYQKGAASLLDYLDAQRTFIANTVEYQQDLALFWGALFRLESAVGEELR